MSKKSSIQGTAEAWEKGELGLTEAHVKKVSPDVAKQIDEALGLQAISIRIPKATIDAYKNLAEIHGVGYQPLMRDAIVRWADGELKQLLAGAVESQRNRPKARATKPVADVAPIEPAPMKKRA